MNKRLEKLLEPGQIGKLSLKNRMIMAPMGTLLAGEWGQVTDTLIEYFARRAKGGVGLIITEATEVATALDPVRVAATLMRLDDICYVPGIAKLAEAVHENGAKICVQISPGAGRQAMGAAWTPGFEGVQDPQTVAPSPIPCKMVQRQPRELTVDEIEKIIKLYGLAAGRVKQAGCDALEVHGHGGYLIAQFLSPYTNKRVDKYGGDFEGRMRFLLELIASARENVGDDFPIIVRWSIDEYLEGGREVEESQLIAKRLEAVGVDALHASAGSYESMHQIVPPMCLPQGSMVHLAKAIKEVVNIPVIAVGRLGDPELAENVLEEGKADFVALGRPLIADPDFPNKVSKGHIEDVRKCTSCNACLAILFLNRPLRCAVNAEAGREDKLKIRPADKARKVMIIGAGPAGMEAARVAGLRGHQVSLYEKTSELGGGQLKLAWTPLNKEELKYIVDYYSAQFAKLDNVKIEFGKEVTSQSVENEKPEVVVIATGGRPFIPDIPGVKNKNVLTVNDVLGDKAEIGERIIIAGGDLIGCDTANSLAAQGKKVTIIQMQDEIATDVEPVTRGVLLHELSERQIMVLTQTKIQEITDRGVIIIDKNRDIRLVESDTVMLALGVVSENMLQKDLEGKSFELYTIGDCREPGMIIDAIHEGYRVANVI